MKIKYSNHTYGEKVVVQLSEGKPVTLKADDEIEVSDADGKGLLELEAFTVVKDTATKNSSKQDKGE